ncbi:depupylase/deamidase Dop [Psychromicrobium xiongbiense]|uniref:depupylase/deamidase Dop n=1 Tax=Psychromicrobium xiongbiense TaxID=3051184 RepID=UPI003B2105A2
MGSETEYGIHAPAEPGCNATWLSTQVVHAYALLAAEHAAGGAETRWDYTDEQPLADARGWTLDRSAAHPSQLTDADRFADRPWGALGGAESILTAAGVALSDWQALDTADPVEPPPRVSNMVLGNGARLYVDHAHPEYSSPEVIGPQAALIWDFAGDVVARQIVDDIDRRRQQVLNVGGSTESSEDALLPAVQLYKNNTDGKGASYGSHENYLVPRAVPFRDLVTGLTPFFVTRPLICGSGRVGLGQDGSTPGFQISQRADFFEAEVGLETTIRRPIINTRDEPHAVAEKYRRLHVIVGDANLSQVSHFLKFGSTALVLGLIERGLAPRLEFPDPVDALHTVSHDVGLSHRYRLNDGRRVSALDVQWMYWEVARQASAPDSDQQTEAVLRHWAQTLEGLATGPAAVAGSVEWAAKLGLLQQYRERDHLEWSDPRLALIDLQWADVRLDKGLANRLQTRGALATLVPPSWIEAAVLNPPEDTRAYFRGQFIRQFGAHVVGASWDSVVVELAGRRRVQKIPTREPLRGTRALTGELFDAQLEVEEFVSRLLGD